MSEEEQLTTKELLQRKHVISTSCGDCVFAQYSGRVQTGCDLGRIEKFVQQNTNILVHEDEEENRKHFVILERICNACRNQDWGKKQKTKDLKDAVKQEIQIGVAAYVISDNSGFESVRKTVDSLLSQSLKPKEIVIVLSSDEPPGKYLRYMKTQEINKWRIDTVSKALCKNKHSMMQESLRKNNHLYLCIGHAGFEFPEKYLEYIDRHLNYYLDRFVMLLPYDKDGNGLFVQKYAFKRAGGYKETVIDDDTEETNDVVDKINRWAKDGEFEHMIKEVKDICPK